MLIIIYKFKILFMIRELRLFIITLFKINKDLTINKLWSIYVYY